MGLILLQIQTGPNSYINGESGILNYQNALLIENVSFDITVEEDKNTEGKRSIRIPKMSSVTLQRRADSASLALSRQVLGVQVAQYPWTLTFMRSLAGGSPSQGYGGQMQVPFLTMILSGVIVTNQSLTFDDGMPAESLTVNATNITWNYTQFDSTSTPVGTYGFQFDLQAGQVQ